MPFSLADGSLLFDMNEVAHLKSEKEDSVIFTFWNDTWLEVKTPWVYAWFSHDWLRVRSLYRRSF